MKKLALVVAVLLGFSGSAFAQYTFKTYAAPTGGQDLIIYAINKAGRMVGRYWIAATGQQKAVRIDAMRRFLPLEIQNASEVIPQGLNNTGDISGTCIVNGKFRAFIVFKNGAVKINSISGSTFTRGAGLNDLATRVGTFEKPGIFPQGFVATNSGKVSVINHSRFYSNVLAINNSNMIVGNYEASTDGSAHERGFSKASGKPFVDFDAPGAWHTWPYRINNGGEIVGTGFESSDGPAHGFSYYQGVYQTVDPPGSICLESLCLRSKNRLLGEIQELQD